MPPRPAPPGSIPIVGPTPSPPPGGGGIPPYDNPEPATPGPHFPVPESCGHMTHTHHAASTQGSHAGPHNHMMRLSPEGTCSFAYAREHEHPHDGPPLPETPYGAPDPPAGKAWVIDWYDKFEGNAVDSSKWTYPPASWTRKTRNHEGYDIDWRWRQDNVAVQDGDLVLTNTRAVPSPRGGDAEVYAAAVYSRHRYTTKYGYFEARIKLAPIVDGTHTAFWLHVYGQQPDPGAADGAEIDIVETVYESAEYAIAVHWDSYSKRATNRPAMSTIQDGDYHVWAVFWHESGYDFYADGELTWSYSDAGLLPEDSGVSHVPEFIFLTTGASWADGNAFTGSFPNEARVDWVRVWKANPVME